MPSLAGVRVWWIRVLRRLVAGDAGEVIGVGCLLGICMGILPVTGRGQRCGAAVLWRTVKVGAGASTEIGRPAPVNEVIRVRPVNMPNSKVS